jgi:phage gp36-like protein
VAYCTQTDLEERYSSADLVRFTDHDGDGAADGAVIDQAIADADAEIDSYLGVRYQVPLATTPESVTNVSITIAWYRLALGRDSVSEAIRKAYEDAIKWLEGVAAGRISIGADPAPSEAGGAATVHHDVDDKHFDREDDWL